MLFLQCSSLHKAVQSRPCTVAGNFVAYLQESTPKGQQELVRSDFEVLFDRCSVLNELVLRADERCINFQLDLLYG